MRSRSAGRILKNSVLKGAAGNGAAVALTRGVHAAGQAGASANEFLRVRRDPTEIAIRRRRAAVRRVKVWGAGAAVGVAGGVALTVTALADGLGASSIFSMILVAALVIWCLVGLARGAVDLRRRTAEVAALPPPQPPRRAVAPQIRGEMAKLDSYSDGLRRLSAMLPVASDGAMTGLQRDVVASADAAERLLRQQAKEYSQLRRTASDAPRSARPTLSTTADVLAGRIRAGIGEYGRLVSAATETVAASTELTGALADLRAPTDRLHALTMGMREIAEHAGTPRTSDPHG